MYNQSENNPETPKVLVKQIPIAVGFYVISPFGTKYNSYFGTDCNKWFLNEMLKLQQEANKYFQTNLELLTTPQEEESFQLAEECWLCEEPFDSLTQNTKVRDHDHLTGKYRGAAHSKCNINCKQSHQVLFPYFSIIFLGMIVILYLKNS